MLPESHSPLRRGPAATDEAALGRLEEVGRLLDQLEDELGANRREFDDLMERYRVATAEYERLRFRLTGD